MRDAGTSSTPTRQHQQWTLLPHALTQSTQVQLAITNTPARSADPAPTGPGAYAATLGPPTLTHTSAMPTVIAARVIACLLASLGQAMSAGNCTHSGKDMMGATCADYGAGEARWQTNNVPLMDAAGDVSLTFNLSCRLQSRNSYYAYDLPGCCSECQLTLYGCDVMMPLNSAKDDDWTPWNTTECDAPAADPCAMKWRRGLVTGGTYPPSVGTTEQAKYAWCRDVAGVQMPVQRLPCEPRRCRKGCRPVYSWYEVDAPPFNVTDHNASDFSLMVSDIVMLGWVTQANGSLTFDAGAGNLSLWMQRSRDLQQLGFRVHPYVEFNPAGAVQMASNTTLAKGFYRQVSDLMVQGNFDGLQYSVEGCVAQEETLISQYKAFISGLKASLGVAAVSIGDQGRTATPTRELGVWIHGTCDTLKTDFCMSCVDYANSTLDRVLYYGPQYMGSMNEEDVVAISNAQLVLGEKGTPGLDPSALSGSLFWRPTGNKTLDDLNAMTRRGLPAIAFQSWPVPTLDSMPGSLLVYRQNGCGLPSPTPSPSPSPVPPRPPSSGNSTLYDCVLENGRQMCLPSGKGFPGLPLVECKAVCTA